MTAKELKTKVVPELKAAGHKMGWGKLCRYASGHELLSGRCRKCERRVQLDTLPGPTGKHIYGQALHAACDG